MKIKQFTGMNQKLVLDLLYTVHVLDLHGRQDLTSASRGCYVITLPADRSGKPGVCLTCVSVCVCERERQREGGR